MVLLKYHYVLPGNKIQAILKDLCGLRVSEGGIAQALQRLGRFLEVEADVILKKVRGAKVPKAFLGKNVSGTLVSDFYSAYGFSMTRIVWRNEETD